VTIAERSIELTASIELITSPRQNGFHFTSAPLLREHIYNCYAVMIIECQDRPPKECDEKLTICEILDHIPRDVHD
jgi:hypothetical protein